jgi:predicted DNA-binding transcriptional regulator AlpA
MMQRTTIVAPQELIERLRRVANDRGVSLATVIREAMEEKAEESFPKPKSLGIASSGFSDTSQRSADERPVPRSWR